MAVESGPRVSHPPTARVYPLAIAILAVLCSTIPGCSWIAERQAVHRCEFRLDGVRIADYSLLDPFSIDLVVAVEATNPNGGHARLDPIRWKLLVGHEEVASGLRSEPVFIPAGERTRFTMDVRLDLWDGARSIVDAILEGRAEYSMPAVVALDTPFGAIDYEVTIREGAWTIEDGFVPDS